MSRHRGRSRPFTARRRIWASHCNCFRCTVPTSSVPGFALFDAHVVRTVAPR